MVRDHCPLATHITKEETEFAWVKNCFCLKSFFFFFNMSNLEKKLEVCHTDFYFFMMNLGLQLWGTSVRR